MPFDAIDKNECHALFDEFTPNSDRLEEANVATIVSAVCYAPLDDGEMVIRLAKDDGNHVDIRTNPVCAGRLAIALLDIINANGWFEVDLRISDTGSDVARIRPQSLGQKFHPANGNR
jgi:hypothetical protein